MGSSPWFLSCQHCEIFGFNVYMKLNSSRYCNEVSIWFNQLVGLSCHHLSMLLHVNDLFIDYMSFNQNLTSYLC